jgi:tetrahydromethanopterin S-methyltransferase subunit B
MDELVGRIAQQIGQQVQTQMTELEERIDHRLGHFATALHHRMDQMSERVETLETRSPTRGSRANSIGGHGSVEKVPGEETQQKTKSPENKD